MNDKNTVMDSVLPYLKSKEKKFKKNSGQLQTNSIYTIHPHASGIRTNSQNIFLAQQLLERDHQTLWHPCTQMHDHENFPPLVVMHAKDSYLHCQNGQKIIDAISSWWCKPLGHGNTQIAEAIRQQLDTFEHVILANTTNDSVVNLSTRLTQWHPHLNKVFYASDGSSAVEIALKMSVHVRQNQRQQQKTKFIALKNGYHGETCGALSVSDIERFKHAYKDLQFPCQFIEAPYLASIEDPTWQNAEVAWQTTEAQLLPIVDEITAIVVEPLIQGSGGMLVYSADYLKRLGHFAKQHDIHLIVDEIFTALGRTGKMLAIEHVPTLEPDFVCVGKGLSGGFLPLSAILINDRIYHACYDNYTQGKTFFHSNTYAGNALAIAAANACLDVFAQEKILDKVSNLHARMTSHMQAIAAETGRLHNVRSFGAVVAADLVSTQENSRLGYQVFQKAVHLGALLRPLGDTIYWCPPLTMGDEVLDELAEITRAAVCG